jgi:AcrR family transcriptional regulator
VGTPARTRNPRGSGVRLADEIVAAAIAVIDESDDPASLTLRGVARRAGVTAPAIYAHFPDLGAVIDGLLAASFDELQSAVQAGRDGQASPAAALIAAGYAYVGFAWHHPGRYRLMFAAGGYAPDAVDTFTLVEEAIASCAEAGVSASDDPHVDTWLLWAALHGVATLEKAARAGFLRLGPLDRRAMLETMIRRIAQLR